MQEILQKISTENIECKCRSNKFETNYLTKRGKVIKSNPALNKEELIAWSCPEYGVSNIDGETLEIVECGSCKKSLN